ncbi:hypothetical protein DC3_23290 [Deinococcus cellulosilyticus NBRC 106333 = KACC 11606]|uniref:Uncharacterized protein n=1 Tax=Deinococcus cellulosilyticus (strain DSM 18568 / NBRC 106333 / KACC 11606 / 5516J-15) TaxID=1223518 RepID=A0A511N1F1_DEIC1|nr:hypothetical protein DC3_23290 [Deinococcus cellulosilyticus NBRC 106333 = KACC 11606]
MPRTTEHKQDTPSRSAALRLSQGACPSSQTLDLQGERDGVTRTGKVHPTQNARMDGAKGTQP